MRDKLIKLLKSWRTWVIGIPLLTGFYFLSRAFNIETVHAYAEKLNGVLAFALLTILPLLGFPVSVLHITAGIKFGVVRGILLVALSILIQLLASYGLVHWRRKIFRTKIPGYPHPDSKGGG